MRLCISGLGVISSIGLGREGFWEGLVRGRSGVTELDRFDCSQLRCHAAAQVVGFDAATWIGAKGLRNVDRPSQFALVAATMAIADAGLVADQMPPERWGVVLGTAFGGQSSLEDCNRERITEGPEWVSPAKFPNTPINAMSYQIPIRHQMRLVNTTVSSGMNSGLDAIVYATSVLRRVPDGVVVCGGVEELSRNAYFSCYFSGELAGLSGPELSCPFDRRRNGYVLGEGAALIVLECPEGLARRGGTSLAEIRGVGSAATTEAASTATRIDATARAMRRALHDADVRPEAVDYIAASANSHRDADAIEARSIAQVWGARVAGIPVGAVKSMTGEAYGASGGFQIAAAVLALQRGTLARTINLDEPDPDCAVTPVGDPDRRTEVRHVLVNSLDRYGRTVSLVLAKAA